MVRFGYVISLLLSTFSLVWTQPDLQGNIVYISHQQMYPGEVVVVRSLISNLGNTQTPAHIQIFAHYYLSLDPQWDPTDIYLGDNQIDTSLPMGESFEEIIRIFNIPDDCMQGQYYLLYVMDPDNLIVETNESNNVDILYPIEIREAPIGKVELVGLISNVSTSYVHPGDLISARSYVRNVGSVSNSVAHTFLTFYMICPDTVWDTLSCIRIGAENFGDPFLPAMQIMLDEDIRIPDTLSPGNYSLWYQVDAEQQVAEFDEMNNIRKWGQVNVSIPWYLRWWAKSSYVIIISISIFFLIKFIIRQRQIRASLREAERIREVEQFKSRFYTNITHEFRTPLTVILGMTQELYRSGQAMKEDVFQHYLENIENSGKTLLLLINQLLDLAKLESDSLVFHPIQADIIPFLRYIYTAFDSYAANKHLQYSFHTQLESLEMDFDPVCLQLILSNLISNAIKFTPEQGKVEVIIGLRESTSNQAETASAPSFIQLTVSDTGIGIAKDQQERVFDRFYQVDDSPTRPETGTGIGLALTREIVYMMEGDIHLKSKLNDGSSFCVSLPISKHAPRQALILQADVPESQLTPADVEILKEEEGEDIRARVLIVEDQKLVVEYMSICLSGKYQLLTASDGKVGLEKAIAEVPDIIITDVMMPEMDGFELCHHLKTNLHTSHIPIIMLTAKASIEDKLQGLSRGADAYLTKPFNQDELFIRIHQLLLLRKRLQQRYRDLSVAPPIDENMHIEDAFLQKLKKRIEVDISDTQLSVPEICKQIGMSHTQLHRKVKALTGRSISRFVRYIRLQKGYELLQSSTLNIAEIAYDVGFKDPNYFSRTFAEEFGATPTEIREQS